MAKISNTSAYPNIGANIDSADYLVLTDAENELKTKTATLSQIQSIITSDIRTQHTTVNSASLLALPSTPVTLVPAPGAGKILNILEIMFYMDAGSVAYNFNLPSNILIDGSASGITVVPSGGSYPGFNMATDTVLHLGNTAGTFYNTPVNAGLVMEAATGQTVSAGNGTAYFNILYRVLDVDPTF